MAAYCHACELDLRLYQGWTPDSRHQHKNYNVCIIRNLEEKKSNEQPIKSL